MISGIHLDPNSGHLQSAIRTSSEVLKTSAVVSICFGVPLEGNTPNGKYALLIMVTELPESRRANNVCFKILMPYVLCVYIY